jgi:hypothetical protein
VTSRLIGSSRLLDAPQHPVTPEGRYFVVRGRLWRCTNPGLTKDQRFELTRELMDARRQKGRFLASSDGDGRDQAKRRINAAKIALAERGSVWWTHGSPDFNRHMARNTTYADWFTGLANDS